MIDEKFTELVNLYFDKEISADELKRLKSEIAANPKRKQAFAERCRLHKAMRMALKPEKSRSKRSRSGSRRRSTSSSSGKSRSRSRSKTPLATRVSPLDESVRSQRAVPFPRWLLASGVAASVLVGLMLLYPVFLDTTNPQAQPALVGVSEKDLIERDPLAALGKSELRRYAVLRQQREAKHHASLISQMRLMGLRPELTPENKELKEVSMAAVYKPKQRVNQAELFQRIQKLNAMPEPKLLRFEESDETFAPSWTETSEPLQMNFKEL